MTTTQKTVTLEEALNFALRCYQEGQDGELENVCGQILQALPGQPDALHLLALAALRQGRNDAALQLVEPALTRAPANPYMHNTRGEALRALGRRVEALSCYGEALRLKADFAEAHNNLAVALRDMDRHEDALHHYRHALAARPDYPVALNNLGNLLRDLGRLDEAQQCFERALQLAPDFAGARFNLALNLLFQGNYREGFALYEARFEGGRGHYPLSWELYRRFAATPRWDGAPLAGRRLLVWTEQGLGDTLMMLRFFPLLVERGAGRIVVQAEAGLIPTLGCVKEIDEVVGRDPFPAADSYDVQCPVMSLPHLLGITLTNLPCEVPYLRVPDALSERWRTRLEGLGGLRVGLVWAAGKQDDRDIRLADLAPLAALTGVTWFSLQKGEAAGQLASSSWPMHDWMDDCKVPFLDTAALIEHLDLVISVDTSIAHLAGALGKSLWVLLRYESEWRWMMEREDSPWYPSARLFRQRSRSGWAEVVERLATALGNLIEATKERNVYV